MKCSLIIIMLTIHFCGARMHKDAKIYVAGHTGLVGSAIIRELERQEYHNLLTIHSAQLDLRNQAAVQEFFEHEKPDYVFLAAATVGGILANNTRRAEFIYDNVMIAFNVIDAAYKNNCTKLLFLGSSCIYPQLAPQPIDESVLLTGALEPTNEPYAVAKIAGIKLCQAYRDQYGVNFISCMPTNLYGPGDNFDLTSSHVLPALIRKIYTAQKNNEPTVTLWGTGRARREFLFVEDLAQALIFLMNHYDDAQPINIGCGTDVTILELAQVIQKVIGYQGTFVFDTSKPDGTPQKLLKVDKLAAQGWHATTSLEEGIAQTIVWGEQHNVFE